MVTTSYRNMESTDSGAGRFDPHHVVLLESASTVQFEQLIWQMPIWGQSGADKK